MAADLVLYCTGYLKSYEYLEGDMRARLDLQKDGLYLYRNVLPYAVPHLAFVGSEVRQGESAIDQSTSMVQPRTLHGERCSGFRDVPAIQLGHVIAGLAAWRPRRPLPC